MKCPACESTDIKLYSRDRILGGAAAGAAAGSIVPVVGTLFGGMIGALGGAMSNYSEIVGGEKRYICQKCQNKFTR